MGYRKNRDRYVHEDARGEVCVGEGSQQGK